MQHPLTRPRRIRKHKRSRDLFAENFLHRSQLISPLFITEGTNRRVAVQTMPGVEILSLDLSLDYIRQLSDSGIKNVVIFPKIEPGLKTADASYAMNSENFLYKAIATIKRSIAGINVISDVALDPYTAHGHDGILSADGFVDNDKTVELLCKQALFLAESGCDVLAPSDMMDGKVLAIRNLLEEHGFSEVQIFSYSAKYASKFYGPFRDCVGSKQREYIDKTHYQLNPANVKEALMKVSLDIAEGADAVIVKPASFYLDVVRAVEELHLAPIIAYQVSGEYAMLKFAAQNGAFDYIEAQMEMMLSCKRAGASAIITYAALEIANFLYRNNF